MIDRVLNRAFLLAQAAAVHAELEGGIGDEGLDDAGVAEARETLGQVLELEGAGEEGAPSAEEREAWIPRDPTLSVLQSVIEERLHEHHADLLAPAEELEGPGGPLATELLGEPEAPGDFTKSDPGWVTGVAKALVRRLLRGRHPFVCADPPPQCELADDARVILIGDWGTGGPAARAVASQVRAELDDAGDRQTHVIHLGDVYYSGEAWESQERFLDRWPVSPEEAQRHHSWSLIGNHDMYSGGWGYFDRVLQDERFSGQRTSDGRGISYFRIANADWQVLGLDTAWDDHLIPHGGHAGFLRDPQGAWVADSVAASNRPRTMLLSHHQLLSTHGGSVGDLEDKLKPAFEAGGIDAWFWGHEHRCQTFSPRPELRYGACVGNGAVPQPLGDARPDEGEWEFDEGGGSGGRWRLCGFAVLDFAGPEIAVRYLDQNGHRFEGDRLPEDARHG